MNATPFNDAISRIEAQVQRIERALATPRPPSNLAERHERLRAETRAAIADLGRLLGERG